MSALSTPAKLAILSDAAKYDASCASSGARRGNNGRGIGHATGSGICHSYTPDGRCVSLLKILLTNYCIYDCQFCINRVSSATPRARFTVDEVVTLTMGFYRRNYIEGLFLSSGIIQSPDYTQEQINLVVRKLREEEHFGGYIHVKAIPGANSELLETAGRYADRLSANIELPRERDLNELAPAKTHQVIQSTMGSIKEKIDEAKDLRSNPHFNSRRSVRFAPGGQSTQLIVGATSATDADILVKAHALYSRFQLRRVYYSAFSPIPDSAPGVPAIAAPLMREHRLYQADWLLRYYGFDVDELVGEQNQHLSLQHDPKFTWAIRNPERFPVDVNKADREMLLRVPGFGVRTVERILRARTFGRLRFAELARLRVPLSRAKFFIWTDEPNPALTQAGRGATALLAAQPQQLMLFEARSVALTGEL